MAANIVSRGSSKEEMEQRVELLKKENQEIECFAEQGYFDYIFTNDFTGESISKLKTMVEGILSVYGFQENMA